MRREKGVRGERGEEGEGRGEGINHFSESKAFLHVHGSGCGWKAQNEKHVLRHQGNIAIKI